MTRRIASWLVWGALAAQVPAVAQSASDGEMARLRRRLDAAEQEVARLRAEAAKPAPRVPKVPMILGTDDFPGVMTLLSRKPRLGIAVRMRADDATDGIGAVIESVTPEGPAAEAGLRAGDVVVRWDGEPLAGRYPAAREGQSEPATKLVDLANELEEGDAVTVTYRRDGAEKEARLTARVIDAGARSGWLGKLDTTPPGGWDTDLLPPLGKGWTLGVLAGRWADIELVKVGAELGEYFGTDSGLLVLRAPSDDPFGLRVGDVILTIGDREPRDTAHALRILRSYEGGEKVRLQLMRKQQRITLEAEMPGETAFGRLALPLGFRASERTI